jgi:splicing factor 3A subunit 2
VFNIQYPEIESGAQPRYRFMSAFEQRVEVPHKEFQYLIFAADPYESIAFKIPNQEIEKDISGGKFYYNWDKEKRIYTLQLWFKEKQF